MCPYENEEARRLWSKACNKCRGTDPDHNCGNPNACLRRFEEARQMEKEWERFVRRWI